MHRLAKMFSLKIDLHCHIVMEHHFRIPGIPSSEMKKLSQGVADITPSHKGGWCVCVRERERERECWVTLKTALSFSRSPSTGRCVWGRKDVISCILSCLRRIILDGLAVLSDKPTPMLGLAASCKGAWQSKKRTTFSSVQFSLTAVSDSLRPMDCSTPGLPVHHQLLEFTQTHVHWVGDVSQPSHPLSSPSPPVFNLSQHQGLF